MTSNRKITPREIHNDLEDLQHNFVKLKAFNDDDKTETAILRSRVDDQSKLIMILKQRADKEIIHAQTLDNVNQNMIACKEQADAELKLEMQKSSHLEDRFHSLSSNHDEMIKIKDEYKHVNKQLREVNVRLKTENSELFSKELLEKDNHIQDLQERFAVVEQDNKRLNMKFRARQEEWLEQEKMFNEQLRSLMESSAKTLEEAQHRSHNAEQHLNDICNKLLSQEASQQNMVDKLNCQVISLTKEKDDLLDLAMQRGKLIQNDQMENKRLQGRIKETERQIKDTREKFERDSAAVNANIQVRKLKEQLKDCMSKYDEKGKEFNAYKKHSCDLLKQEKELNERLRHLVM